MVKRSKNCCLLFPFFLLGESISDDITGDDFISDDVIGFSSLLKPNCVGLTSMKKRQHILHHKDIKFPNIVYRHYLN